MKTWTWVLLFLFIAVVVFASTLTPISPIGLDKRLSELEDRVEALEQVLTSRPAIYDQGLDIDLSSDLRREFRELKEHMEEMEWWYRRRER